ncbi:MAG: pyridoxal phosphate-dependent aminotransferase [Patescibacteria group bacterium]
MREIGILDINEQATKIPQCIRFDKGSAKFPFPDELLPLIDEIKQDITNGYFAYPAIGGEKTLKERIAELERKNGRDVSPDDIVITHGGISGIFSTLGVIARSGDEVITNSCFFEGFSLAMDHFKLKHRVVDLSDSAALKSTITPKTRVIILNSPENPTGKVYSPQEISEIETVAKESGIFLLSDEVTNEILYDGIPWTGPSMSNTHAVAVNSFSKNWFIPGIRVGWTVSKEYALNKDIANFLSAQSAGVNLFGQLLMAKALERIDHAQFIEKRLTILSMRRSVMKKALDMQGIHYLFDPQGGMNFYIDVRGDSKEVASRLLERSVAVIPGELFEGKQSHYARIGFGSVDEEAIVRGIASIAEMLQLFPQ